MTVRLHIQTRGIGTIREAGSTSPEPGVYDHYRVGEVTGLPPGSTFWDAAAVWSKANPPTDVHTVAAPENYIPESKRSK